MPLNRSSIFLEVIQGLSKSIHISEGDELAMAKEILYKASHFLKIQRANAWFIDENSEKLECLIAYDSSIDKFYKEDSLYAKDFPLYFTHIRRNDIIISFDAQKEIFNSELLESYLIPHNILSMLEVPILSGGKLKGILCFENTKEIRAWSHDEQHFALALTQLLTITLETKEKNDYRDQLEKLVKEKTILIAEINHRVKNNLAVINALIRAESNRAKDKYHKELFDNVLSKSFSLSTLQNAMYQSQNYQRVNFSDFIQTLVSSLNDTYGHNLNVNIQIKMIESSVEVSKAIPCALIVNELLTNCFKHAFQQNRSNELSVKLGSHSENSFELVISDNGPGLPEDYLTKGTGFELIEGLVDQIDGILVVDSNDQGTTVSLTF